MERFFLEEPSIKRKEEAIEYVLEHIQYNSNMSGTGGLDKNYLNYEEWLEKNELMKYPNTCQVNRCPAYTFFLIRDNDNKIIGMINIRYNLTEYVEIYGGHIGYGIRPTERCKGYNKINLYLGLLKARDIGLDKVLLTALDSNPASYKTILSLGGVLENKIPDDKEDTLLLGRYWINVEESIKKYYSEYENRILKKVRNEAIESIIQ